MAHKVEILPTAWEDLKRIQDHYTIESGPDAAIKLCERILKTIDRLSEYPDSGSATPEEWLNERGYRMLICGKHVAIYRKVGRSVYTYHIADTRTRNTRLFD